MEKFRDIPIWVIVLAFIFMWPVGFILVVLKYVNKNNVIDNKVSKAVNTTNIIRDSMSSIKLKKMKSKSKRFKKLTIIQCIIAIVFFIALISDMADGDFDNIQGGIIVNVLAFSILAPVSITYFKTNNLVKKIETYQNLILIRDIYDTRKLATYMNCSREEVLNFVTYMIREGFLELDIENENIVKPKEYVDPAQVFSMVCQSCGANNKYIKGKNNVCEYCGTVLNLQKI